MTDSNRVVIFDTTLRDGEQSPGASMNLDGKLSMASALAKLGVDIIEAGFPIASNGDFEAVREIARRIEGPTIAGLARCHELDIHRAWDALKDAPRAAHPRLSRHQRHPPRVQARDGKRGDRAALRGERSDGAESSATTWSSLPRTPPEPSSTSSPRWWSGRSPPAPRR